MPVLFRRRRFSGNPPHAPVRYGWVVRLWGPSRPSERAWLKAHGYRYAGGKWLKPDRAAYVAKSEPARTP